MGRLGMVTSNKAEQAEWQAECDMRALMEAEEVRRDPKRLAAATKKAKDKLMELASVAGGASTEAKKS